MNASEEENNAEWKSKKDVQPIMYHLICKLKLYIPSNNEMFYKSIYKQNNRYKIVSKSKYWMRVGNNSV